MLLARIQLGSLPASLHRMGKPMRIIAFVTEVGSVERILEYLGEPTTPPPIASARGPPN